MDNHNSKPVVATGKQRSATERSAIRGDYKKWKDSLSFNDLVNFAKKCYNEYSDYSNDLSLPRDVRNSYGDRAFPMKAILDYIERQAA